MSDPHSCDRACSLAGFCQQPQTCSTPSATISVAEVLARFEREAAQGVCDTGRYRCRYFVWGEGPPLLFVPGLADHARAFVMPISRLVGHFRCIGMDLPKGGLDGANLSRYRHEDLTADVIALLDHLQLPRCYVYGSSFGTTITLRTMHVHPERVPRAILQGGFARRPLRWSEWALATISHNWPGKLHHLPLHERVLRHVHRGHFDARSPEAWKFYMESHSDFPIHATAHQALMLNKVDLRPLLPLIGQPVLLVSGTEDRVVPPAFQEELLAGLPNARMAELQKSGHVPYHTHPEALADLMRQFLTPPEGAAFSMDPSRRSGMM